jgi:hypothetical protein
MISKELQEALPNLITGHARSFYKPLGGGRHGCTRRRPISLKLDNIVAEVSWPPMLRRAMVLHASVSSHAPVESPRGARS